MGVDEICQEICIEWDEKEEEISQDTWKSG